MSPFDGLPDQPEARRALEAALARPSHAYLFAGPAGSSKSVHAERFAAHLLGCPPRAVTTRSHPDLFVLEPEGSSILIDDARRLRRDLHLRPFQADRRVYLILDAHLLRDESANALLKSLEEPPDYGVFVLVSDHAGRMLPTILSRVAVVPFRRFSRAQLEERTGDRAAAAAALGDLGRAEQLAGDPEAAERRRTYLSLAAACGRGPGFDAADAAATVLAAATIRAKAEAARVDADCKEALAVVDDAKEERGLRKRYEERGKRAARRAEWEELRLAVDTVSWWYRDLAAARLGAGEAVVNSDVSGELATSAAEGEVEQAAEALAITLEVRRSLELNVHPALALEAMFHRLARVFAPAAGATR
jgi:DNA polymerase III subunit delta'